MANQDNLIPIKKGELSNEEAKRRGSMGGKRSVEVKKEKKNIKQGLEIVLGILTDETLKEAKEKGSKDGSIEMLQEGGYLSYKLAKMLTDKSVKHETELKIIQEIIDRVEGKANQFVSITDDRDVDVPARESREEWEEQQEEQQN